MRERRLKGRSAYATVPLNQEDILEQVPGSGTSPAGWSDDEPADVSLSPQRIEAKGDRSDMHDGLVDAGAGEKTVSGYGSQHERAGTEAAGKHLTELERIPAEMGRAPRVDSHKRRSVKEARAPPIVQCDECRQRQPFV
ncbi:MAG: hypothetical protein GEV13_15425 [Rhodospirillales bacterium]|nr:hypothetical protein [Rhodospirillales bacterium]